MTYRQHLGLSLVELLVAIAIGLILTAGLVQIVVSNKANYEIIDDMAKLQENARFAVEFITRDLRMAGFYGCADDPSTTSNSLPLFGGSGFIWDTTFPIEGFDAELNANWQPSAYSNTSFPVSPASTATSNSNHCAGAAVGSRCTGSTAAAGADMITMRHIMGSASMLISAADATSVTVPIGSDFAASQFIAVYDCSSTDIAYVSSAVDDTGAGTKKLNLWAGTPLSKMYSTDNNTRVAPIRFVRYYVGTGEARTTISGPATAGPALFRRQLSNDPAAATPTGGAVHLNSYELVPGVENMQIRYGVDVDSDGLPDEYVRAGEQGTTADLRSSNSDEWFNVITVRIGLLLRTEDEYGGDFDSTSRTLNGTNIGAPNPSDRRRRRTFTTTVRLRNFQ